MAASELTEKLGLNDIRNRRVINLSKIDLITQFIVIFAFHFQWYIQATCATQATGLYEGLDWLARELEKA